ncbi:MAG: aliphatic sulfonates ABC transporter substrate-binding protein, partial [Desulfosporosinus sp.]|nr:aliphatic sulfonates ABC transporter substrate-binding protein [Desulfosporosinus sp.]
MFRSKILALLQLSALVLISFIILTGCTPTPKTATQAPTEKLKTINASYVSRPINVPSVVAREKGLFETE